MLHKLIKPTPRFFITLNNHSHSTQICYMTDIEGRKVIFDMFKRSQVVRYNADSGLHFNNTKGTSYFIFGGDATDRGCYDLAITQMLVEFKKRHPDRVILLAGNREIKNCRFSIELAPQFIQQRLISSKTPHWIKQPTVPLDYVKKSMVAQGIENQANLTGDAVQDYVNSLSIEQCQLFYLHWMLEKTMGCPHTFRYRREELARRLPNKTVSDGDVLQSFLNETAPSGLMGQYLQLSQVGALIPNTGILAVHGGLSPYNIGRVPNTSLDEKRYENAQEWINAINTWYTSQIQRWIGSKATALIEPGCTELDKSVLPVPGKEKYVMTADMLDNTRQFSHVPEDVMQYLNNNKISVVLTGHQPCGDHPAVLRNDKRNIVFINGDTGYAKMELKDPDNTHGVACHTVEIDATQDEAKIYIQATLSDATSVKTSLTITANQIDGDKYIGKLLPENRLVQCKLPDNSYRIIQQNGFHVTYTTLNSDELAKQLGEEQIVKQNK